MKKEDKIVLINDYLSRSSKAKEFNVVASLENGNIVYSRTEIYPVVNVEKKDLEYVVSFRYDPFLVDEIKKIVGWIWKSNGKYWSIPIEQRQALQEFVRMSKNRPRQVVRVGFSEVLRYLDPSQATELVSKLRKEGGEKKTKKIIVCKEISNFKKDQPELEKYINCIAGKIRDEIGGSVKKVFITKNDIGEKTVFEVRESISQIISNDKYVLFYIVKTYPDDVRVQFFFTYDLDLRRVIYVGGMYNNPHTWGGYQRLDLLQDDDYLPIKREIFLEYQEIRKKYMDV